MNRAEFNLNLADIQRVVATRGIDPWYVYAYRDWTSRTEPRSTCARLADGLDRNSRVLESGCGGATNLIWLGCRCGVKLFGFDHDQNVLGAARDLCELAGVQASLWLDDGLAPSHMVGQPFDAILAINWIHYAPDIDLPHFFAVYSPLLTAGGILAIEVIDWAYNDMAGNREHTADRGKPMDQRRPSEYINRFSRDQVASAACGANLRIVDEIRSSSTIPRPVYLLKRR
jgi:hypothetical protein